MPSIVPYKMLEIATPDPTGAAGLMLNNNIKTIADNLDTLNTNMASMQSDITIAQDNINVHIADVTQHIDTTSPSITASRIGTDSITQAIGAADANFVVTHNGKRTVFLLATATQTSSGMTPVQAGYFDGQILKIIVSTAGAITLTIQSSGNTKLKGNFVVGNPTVALGTWPCIDLIWDNTNSCWREINRKNIYNGSASGGFAYVEGYWNIASGSSSHAEGSNTTASGSSAHSEGSNTTSSAIASHAENYLTIASGNYSHAEGVSTTASGIASNASGTSTTASGDYSHAEGRSTVASGDYSHAEGRSTVSISNYSHASGFASLTRSEYEFAHATGDFADGSSSVGETQYRRTVLHKRVFKDAPVEVDIIAEAGNSTTSIRILATGRQSWQGNVGIWGALATPISESASFNVWGLFDYESGGAILSKIGSADIAVPIASGGAGLWDIDLDVNTAATNPCVVITSDGALATQVCDNSTILADGTISVLGPNESYFPQSSNTGMLKFTVVEVIAGTTWRMDITCNSVYVGKTANYTAADFGGAPIAIGDDGTGSGLGGTVGVLAGAGVPGAIVNVLVSIPVQWTILVDIAEVVNISPP